MKQIKEYIEINKKRLDDLKIKLDNTSIEDESEQYRLKEQITIFESYIMGLEDAKKYIEEEKENN